MLSPPYQPVPQVGRGDSVNPPPTPSNYAETIAVTTHDFLDGAAIGRAFIKSKQRGDVSVRLSLGIPGAPTEPRLSQGPAQIRDSQITYRTHGRPGRDRRCRGRKTQVSYASNCVWGDGPAAETRSRSSAGPSAAGVTSLERPGLGAPRPGDPGRYSVLMTSVAVGADALSCSRASLGVRSGVILRPQAAARLALTPARTGESLLSEEPPQLEPLPRSRSHYALKGDLMRSNYHA